MAEYKLPQFNLTCNIWHNGGPPEPPDVLDEVCQLYVPTKTGLVGLTTNVLTYPLEVYVRLPKGTDVRYSKVQADQAKIECPAGSGVMYLVRGVVDAHKGFPNEYRVAVCVMAEDQNWPLP